MNLPVFDQTKKGDSNTYGETVRLSNELRYRPAGNIQIMNDFGQLETVWDEGRLWGFDVETADYAKLVSYFTDNRIKKRSQSLIAFINRIISIRFETEYTNDKTRINKLISMREFELIQSEGKNEAEWFGEVSYQNMVRLDGSLTNNKTKTIKLKNGGYKIVRK